MKTGCFRLVMTSPSLCPHYVLCSCLFILKSFSPGEQNTAPKTQEESETNKAQEIKET